ncbi:uncharacterized protein LOC106650723 isoform X2 [Trichogramma pretiosum]|uniref:uncharacterized protein LOC106650723 isoform X2 n=1 Tax=Trichogramma pretiosum TaxID=7493 RepID=UPI0006C971AD|nr:uncharacterized protein LOC106650723 isoform X2 [Trichogramma pretiosum]
MRKKILRKKEFIDNVMNTSSNNDVIQAELEIQHHIQKRKITNFNILTDSTSQVKYSKQVENVDVACDNAKLWKKRITSSSTTHAILNDNEHDSPLVSSAAKRTLVSAKKQQLGINEKASAESITSLGKNKNPVITVPKSPQVLQKRKREKQTILIEKPSSNRKKIRAEINLLMKTKIPSQVSEKLELEKQKKPTSIEKPSSNRTKIRAESTATTLTSSHLLPNCEINLLMKKQLPSQTSDDLELEKVNFKEKAPSTSPNIYCDSPKTSADKDTSLG